MTDTVGQAPSGNPPSYLVQAMMQQYYNNMNNPQGANAMQNGGAPAGTNTQTASAYGGLSQIANTYTQQQLMKQMMQGYQAPQQPNQAIDVSGMPNNNGMLTMGSLGGQQ